MRLFPITLYIAGPMTGLPEFNYPAFMHAEKQLTAEGHLVINPAHNKGKTWTDFMRVSLRQLSEANGVYFLNGWESSKGAKLEHQIATDLGLMIRYEPEPKRASAEKEIRMMKAEGASTTDLGRELLRKEDHPSQGESLRRTIVDARDLRAVLLQLGVLPSSTASPELLAAYKRLSSTLGM